MHNWLEVVYIPWRDRQFRIYRTKAFSIVRAMYEFWDVHGKENEVYSVRKVVN